MQKCIRGRTAAAIVASIESAMGDGKLEPGEKLPTIRTLARSLGVSPATVAAAFQSLQMRGLAVAQGRRGTRISHRPTHRVCRAMPLPPGARNLYDGNPDPTLLPPVAAALRSIDTTPHLYGQPNEDPQLVELLRADFSDCGVGSGDICMVYGAMDGVDRVLTEHLRAGDRVAIEDPGFGNVHDLVSSRGLSLVPTPVDHEGLTPDGLAKACRQGAKAVVVTPRVQNPTGAALTPERIKALRAVLRSWPDVLVIEDDHASMISGVDLYCLHDGKRGRWAYIRSLSKALNPDLRMAALTGDEGTMTRVRNRLVIGERWVSHILQRTVYALLADAGVREQLTHACGTYQRRREALTRALAEVGIHVRCRSGYNVWVPVAEETATVQSLLAAGWAVAAGERFRIDSPPAIRITAATLEPDEAKRLARDFAMILSHPSATAMV